MQLNLFQNIGGELSKMNISDFIKEITERLTKMEEELVIDRFEENIAVCEDRKTGNIKEILKNDLPEGVTEGSLIKEENGKYIKLEEKQKEIEKRIEDKMNKLWNN